MSQSRTITYRLEADEDVLRAYAQDTSSPIDFFVHWPEWLGNLESEPSEEELSELTDEMVGAVVARLRVMGMELTDVYEHSLRHVMYLLVAPGGPIVHPLTFEVREIDEFVPCDISEELRDSARFAEKTGWSLWARQVSEFAPAADKADDYVIVVLRGEHARAGREALNAVVDLTRKAVTGGDGFAA